MRNVRTSVGLLFGSLIVAACGFSDNPGPASQGFAMSSSVKMVLSVQSSSRQMTAGDKENYAGEVLPCCTEPNVPFGSCPANAIMDGRNRIWFGGRLIVAHGVFHQNGARASVARSAQLSGPFNCVSGGKNQWRFNGTGAAATAHEEIAHLEYWDVNPSEPFGKSEYTIEWKERDPFDGDDKFKWHISVDNWINSCRRASNGKNGTFNVDQGSFGLCAGSACRNGSFEVGFSVECTVSGADERTEAPPPPAPRDEEGRRGGETTSGVPDDCFPDYNACARACEGTCVRKILCGGASAHKCL
jgi:hypothetical protein